MLNSPPTETSFDDGQQPRRAWTEWAFAVFRNSKFKGADVTANRPLNGLTVGDWYYDTTLGLPIWVHSIGPVVWHKADGTVA